MKYTLSNMIETIVSVGGAAIASMFGGWSTGIKVLLVIMLIDIITGTLSAILSKSDKTESGRYNSYVSWRGIIKKIVTLLMIAFAYQLDVVLGTTIIRDACVIFFVFNEGTSVLENAGRLGVKYPAIVEKALDVLNKKSETDI